MDFLDLKPDLSTFRIMTNSLRLSLSLVCLILFSGQLSAQDPNPSWTHYRGTNLNGLSTDTGLPVDWNETTNIGWKTAIAGKGWSSPVVYGDQIWLTSEVNPYELIIQGIASLFPPVVSPILQTGVFGTLFL